MIVPSMYYLIKNVHNYDIIFVNGYRSLGVAGVLISKIFRKQCILKASSNGEMSGEFFYTGLIRLGINKKTFLFRFFLRIRNVLLKKADAFVSFSPKITNELKMSGIKSENIYEIPNCFDQNQFFKIKDDEKIKLRKSLNLPVNSKILIFTGRLAVEKGLPFLLAVWNEIQKIHKDALLLLVGSGKDLRFSCEEELKEYVKKNNLSDSVIFTGKVNFDKVHEYLKSSDIFVFPSNDEAFGNSLIEAMACGLPSITTSFIIQHGYNGYSIEIESFNQLYYYIDLLLKNRELIDELGRNALQTSREKYSKSIVVQSYIKLFNNVYNLRENIKMRKILSDI